MPIQMFCSRIPLPTGLLRADVLFVARLDNTSLLPRLRIVGFLEDLVYFGVFVVMSRARLVDGSLIKQRGSRNLDAAGHGGCWLVGVCTAGGGRLGVRVGCSAVGALVLACTQDTSMPVCRSDCGAAAAVLVVEIVVGGERLRRLYSCWWQSRWDECFRHVGMWYTDGSRVMLRVAAKATFARWERQTLTHTRTPWSEDV